MWNSKSDLISPKYIQLQIGEQRNLGDLGVGDIGVFADLGGDGGAELWDFNDVVEVVYVHDSW